MQHLAYPTASPGYAIGVHVAPNDDYVLLRMKKEEKKNEPNSGTGNNLWPHKQM